MAYRTSVVMRVCNNATIWLSASRRRKPVPSRRRLTTLTKIPTPTLASTRADGNLWPARATGDPAEGRLLSPPAGEAFAHRPISGVDGDSTYARAARFLRLGVI